MVKTGARGRARTKQAGRRHSPRLRAADVDRWERLTESVANACAHDEKRNAGPPQSWRISLIKIETYRLVRQLLKSGREALIKRVVGSFDSEPRVITFEQNPFHWAIFALNNYDAPRRRGEAADGKSRGALGMGEEPLNRIGWELMYAHQHDILPELLIGFIYQTASSRSARARVKEQKTEPWLSAFKSRFSGSDEA